MLSSSLRTFQADKVKSRVVDPYSFFPDPDPDPEFDVGNQYGSRALITKNLKKITAENFF